MAELNGAPVGIEQMKALALINYGHFTSMLVRDRAVRGLSLHLDRLVRDCRILFDVDLDRDRVRHFVGQAVADAKEPVIARVTVFDPDLQLGRPGANAEPHVLVAMRAAPGGSLPALRLQSVNHQRDLAAVKHVGLFSTLWHRRKAQRSGYDDVLFVDSAGRVCEGSTWNIGFCDGERILWPEADWLPGVTMTLLNQSHAGVVATEPVSLDRLPSLQAAFATNASVGVRPIAAIDGHSWATDHAAVPILCNEYNEVPPERL